MSWTISNGMVSFRPNRPGTWFSIIASWQTAKYQNYLLNCFSVLNALAIWIKVRHVRSDNPFEDCCTAGAAIMLEPFERLIGGHFRRLISCQSRSENGGVGVPRLI